jgi:V8-like Glu-specific endopeptidase
MTRNHSIYSSRHRDHQGSESEEKITCISVKQEGIQRYFPLAAAITFTAMIMMPATGLAQEAGQSAQAASRISHAVALRPTQIESYWTAERLLSAKPFQIQPQLAADGRPMAASQTPMAAGPSVKVKGAGPTLVYNAGLSKELVSKNDLELRHANLQAEAAVTPQAFSPIGATFTTSRVFPAGPTHTAYPYSTVGALFWTDPVDNSNWFCSASVLRPRIVATAGHCVASPASGNTPAHFHTNFMFIPGWLNGTAPFGVFTAYYAWTTATWYYSNGSVPNAQDVGLLDMNDRNGYKLGQYTGYLGYWTNQLSFNNVTMLGFPCNLDGCEQLEANYAQTFEYGGNNTYIFGSNFGGGSSGGPYIRDFGRAPSGSLTTEGGNWLVAVNSYGPVNLGYLYSGASNLNSEFLTLLTYACNAGGTGGC